MGQFKKAVARADSFEDHVHRMPNGELTGGSLHKPTKDQFDMHSHLYEHKEGTAETEATHNFGDHTHITQHGETSGPMKPQKTPGQPWKKMDSLQREGRVFVLRSSTGHILGMGKTAFDAVAKYDASYDADEVHSKGMMAHVTDEPVDEAKWEKAKEASKASTGRVKWPLVQHIYQNML
jgi:hypothetical protein